MIIPKMHSIRRNWCKQLFSIQCKRPDRWWSQHHSSFYCAAFTSVPFCWIRFWGFQSSIKYQKLTVPGAQNLSKIFLLFCIRDHFLRGHKLNDQSIQDKECLEQSISIIKFIGRQHLQLTDIMNQVNFCYSFKVCNWMK